MADIDLNALSLAELKQLEKNVAKAIASFEDRRAAGLRGFPRDHPRPRRTRTIAPRCDGRVGISIRNGSIST